MFVYILASGRNGTLYTGVTNDPVRRVAEHKQGQVDGFTKKYKVHQLVHYETHEDIRSAITRKNKSRNGVGRGKWN
jgi:putative endonuclease